MSFRKLTVIIGTILATSSCLAQGIFLGKGESAPLVDFSFATAEDSYLFGLSGGYSAGGIFDFGVGGLFGGDGSKSVAGATQFAAIHLLRLDSPERSRFSLSLMQSMVSMGALGDSHYDENTTLSVGGRATLQSGPSKTVVAPFVGYVRAGFKSARVREVDMYEFGLAIVNFSHGSVFVVTPAVATGGGATSFSLSFTLNFLGSGGESSHGGKWRDGESAD